MEHAFFFPVCLFPVPVVGFLGFFFPLNFGRGKVLLLP